MRVNRTSSLFWFSIIFLFKTSSACAPQDLLTPCRCEDKNQLRVIYCGGFEEIDLPSVFKKLSNSATNKTFDVFFLNNTFIRTLPAEVFAGIKFKTIFFDGAIRLEYVHPNAFIGTEQEVERIFAWSTLLNSYRVPNENDAFARLVNLKILDIANQLFCPPDDVISPCQCLVEEGALGIESIAVRSQFVVKCVSEEPYFIRQVFQRIATTEPFCAQHFDRLELDNTAWTNLTVIPEDAFAGVTFTSIQLQSNCPDCINKRLVIDPLAFGKSSLFVQHLELSTGLKAKSRQLRDTFVAINSLPNLKSVKINAGFDIVESHAFRQVSAERRGQDKLKTVRINGGTVETVEGYPFYVLPNLQLIDLTGNRISRVQRHAFAFRDSSSSMVTINLSNNALTSDSFEPDAFSEAKRLIKLILFAPDEECSEQFNYLTENVFSSFFAENNTLHLGGCRLDCADCRMKWMLESPQTIRMKLVSGDDQFGAVNCLDGSSLFESFNVTSYAHCDCQNKVKQQDLKC